MVSVQALLDMLLSTLFVTVYDRDVAVAVFRAARAAGHDVRGRSYNDAEWREPVRMAYEIELIPAPMICEGTCGEDIGRPGMCYQCGCEAHAEGWYSMDSGYARVGRTDAQIHAEMDYGAVNREARSETIALRAKLY